MNCDICNSPMTVDRDERKVSFRCTSCQQAWFVEGDRTSCIVLKTLWPSSMDKNSKMFREEYLPDWQLANKYRAMLLAEAGIWNEQQSNAYLTECQATLENWLLDNPLPRPWWKLWRPAV